MKNFLTFIVYPILGCIIFYLFISFAVWDLNPANWELSNRAACAVVMMIIYIIIIWAIKTNE